MSAESDAADASGVAGASDVRAPGFTGASPAPPSDLLPAQSDTTPLASGSVTADAAQATTGDPRVDDALSRLAEVESLPLSEQVEVFADIHRRLAGVLADPDSRA